MLTADGADQLVAVTSTQCLWAGVQEGACIGAMYNKLGRRPHQLRAMTRKDTFSRR